MFKQHAKLSWRADISSLNLLINSTVWQQEYNGFSHQYSGFIDVVANKSAEVVQIYLPPMLTV
jgi:xylulose-5-phosphate/fructose-6-phosphate phosphoketolase